MKSLVSGGFDDVNAVRRAVYEAMRFRSNRDRLAVCLYLMSDLSDSGHHLSEIERNLRKIFPKSVRQNFLPKDYEDFAASTIRHYFNSKANKRDKLWENCSIGYWAEYRGW